MKQAKQILIDEQTSPLFRIMSIFDDADPVKRKFRSASAGFHVGNGYIISVDHFLHSTIPLVPSAPEPFFQNEILPKLNRADANQLLQHYALDATTQRRYLNVTNEKTAQALARKLRAAKCDTRIETLYSKAVCKPFLIVQFKNNSFFNDATLTSQINPAYNFHEISINRYTFLLQLDLLKAFVEHDMAVYRLSKATESLMKGIPSIEVDYNTYDDDCSNLYCLQSSPSNSNLGHLLNRAQIEGILDHWAHMPDEIAGSYIFEGLRYLIRGYFRFGSSGAPYVKYDEATSGFKVIAIQSEAAPIQLTIKDDREGNYQYVNALASPLSLVSSDLPKLMNP